MISSNTITPKNYISGETAQNDFLVEDVKKKIDNNDVFLLTKLNNLRNDLSGNNLNLKSIRDQIRDLSSFKKTLNYDYLNNLLYPEKSRGCKIPSQVPVPSCAFQLHNSLTVQTNASGNCALIMNPFFLADTTCMGTPIVEDGYFVHKFVTSCWVNNDVGLTGNAANSNWIPKDFSQVLPAVYNQYRLVSAAIQIRYIGRLDEASGVAGGAIILEDLQTCGGAVQTSAGEYNPAGEGAITVAPDLYKYGNFELARDSYYHRDNSCLEGIRMLYFPIDNSYEEYETTLNRYTISGNTTAQDHIELEKKNKNGFNWMFYSIGGPAEKNCFKVDIFCNFECLPDSTFLNYMPISAYPFVLSAEEKKKYIMMVQSKPILKMNEERDDLVEVPDIFIKMIKKFKNGMPGFDRLRAWGLINAVPGLSSGLALAGNMIAMNSMMDYE